MFSVYTTPTGHPSLPETTMPWNDWITPSLAKMSAAHTLQEVAIRVHVWPGSEKLLNRIRTSQLDGMLCSAAFPALRQLRFVVLTEADRFEEVHTVDPILREKLPLLNAKGMLRIEYGRPPNGPEE
jgi:hypothetical protein